jgi:uncharacterized phosphosugar-binding protein
MYLKKRPFKGDSMDSSHQVNRPAALYLRAIEHMLDDLKTSKMETITAAAEQVASRLTAGGQIYAVADEGGFVSEACGRAGGIRQMKHIQPDASSPVTGKDVVLAGTLGHDPEGQAQTLKGYRALGALVIVFGAAQSLASEAVDILIDNGMPRGTNPVIEVAGRDAPVCPTAGVANISALWLFTCELVAACTRLGQTLTMYQSGAVPGGGARNGAYQDVMFHDDLIAPPVAPGKLANEFLAEMTHCFTGLSTQYPRFFQGGVLMAESLTSDHRVWVSGNAHNFAAQNGMPGDPGLFSLNLNEMDIEEAIAAFQPGDTFAYMGYYTLPEPFVAATRAAEMKSVWLQGGCERRYFIHRAQEILIDCGWKYGDACIDLPGYDILIIPHSGVVQTTALWMLVGEAASHG